MKIQHCLRSLVVALFCTTQIAQAADKPQVEEVIARHLDAIGAPEARSAPSGRELDGVVVTRVIVKGKGALQGTGQIMSRRDDLRVVWKFDVSYYPGEDFLYNGKRPVIGQIVAGSRSQLGNFLDLHPEMLSEGLFGGVLSTAWPLLNLQERQAKVSLNGLKKVQGEQLYEMTYTPRKSGGNLKVYLYFNPETYRHVMTVYRAETSPGTFGLNSAGNRAQITSVEERFSDFRQVNGLMLPLRWNIRYVQEQGQIAEWEFVAQKAKLSVDEDAFKSK